MSHKTRCGVLFHLSCFFLSAEHEVVAFWMLSLTFEANDGKMLICLIINVWLVGGMLIEWHFHH